MKLLPCGNDKKPPVQAICSARGVICQYLASFRYFPIFRLLDKSNTADGQFFTHLIFDAPGGMDAPVICSTCNVMIQANCALCIVRIFLYVQNERAGSRFPKNNIHFEASPRTIWGNGACWLIMFLFHHGQINN